MNIYFLLLLIIAVPCYGTASIIPIDSIKEAQHIIEQHAHKALVLIDIDDTVMIAHDKVMRNAHSNLHNAMMALIKQQPNKEQLMTAVFQTARYRLVEEEIASFIQGLTKSAVAVFGFTARSLGHLITQATAEAWTHNKLRELGVIFSEWDTLFHRFKHGILFCGSQPKGTVLVEFLPEVAEHIDTVIMFDDRLDNITNTAEAIEHWNAANEQQIRFIGFHYKAADYHDQIVDMETINRQIHHLITDGVYYSEEAIKTQLATTQNRESEIR